MVQIKDKRYAFAQELIKGVLEKKVSKLIARGFVTINSSEIFQHCLEKLRDDGRCAAATSYAAHLLNRYARRVASYKARWLVTWEFLKTLCGTPYSDLRDTPLSDLDAYCFYYAIAALLYARPVEGDANGDGN
jgi:hypothetical protein